MQILVSHPSPLAGERLRNILMSHPGTVFCMVTTTLTSTYDFAEHNQPDCVVMAASFADCAEFELLDTLFRILGIGCVLMADDPGLVLSSLSSKAREHVIFVTDQHDSRALLDAVRAASQRKSDTSNPPSRAESKTQFDPQKAVLIGASTGGIDALLKTTQSFGTTCPPTLIVQHTGGSFAASLIRLLDGATQAKVEQAQDGMPLKPGHIYLPPGDMAHLCLHKGAAPRMSLQAGPPVSGHRPSVDALFTSAVPIAKNIVAALLTGMGRDGARGMTALREAGATTIGQDQATSVVYGMPRIAKELGGVEQELPLPKIGPALLSACAARLRA